MAFRANGSAAGGDATPYFGIDRRGLVSPAAREVGPSLLVGAAVIVAVFLAAVALASTSDPGTDLNVQLLSYQLDTISASLAALCATLCFVRWRLAGDARGLVMSVAMALLGVGTIAVPRLLPALAPDVGAEPTAWPAMRFAGLVIFAGLVAWMLRVREVDARLRPGRVIGLSVGGLVILTAVTWTLRGTLFTTVFGLRHVLTVSVFTVLSIILTRRGMRRHYWLFSWSGLLLFGLAMAEAARLTAPAGDRWMMVPALTQAAALMFALGGATREFRSLFATQSDQLMRTTVETLTAEARARAALAEQEERAHEARNALTAIEAATVTLQSYRDRLAPEMQSQLTEAVRKEIARLQQLVDAPVTNGHPIPFRVFDVIEHQLSLARSDGLQVFGNVPHDLTALGYPADTAQVLRNLIVNVQRHAADSPVVVRASQLPDGVEIRVEDRGPGVKPADRERIFERGTRSEETGGSGLGLFVSARLMQRQNGTLSVEGRPGGGASFVVRLPSPPAQESHTDEDGRPWRTRDADSG